MTVTGQSSPVWARGEPSLGVARRTTGTARHAARFRSKACADRLLGAEHAVLAEAAVVGLNDLPALALGRRRIEHDDHHELGALAHDAPPRPPPLAPALQHAH